MHKLLLDLPTQFESDRMVLRAYRPGDGPMVFDIGQRNRAHLARFESMNVILHPQTVEEAEIVARELALEWAARRAFFLGAFEKNSGKFVAQVYIGVVNWETPEFEIGYFVDCEFQGRGYASEAARAAMDFIFRDLGAHRIRLECSDANARSIRLAERLGFSREAYFRENRREPDGTYSGTLIYGLLRRDHQV